MQSPEGGARAEPGSEPHTASNHPGPSAPPPPKEIIFDDVKNLKPAGTPLNFPSPLHLLRVIAPELKPHPWQAQELLRLGGYLDPFDQSNVTAPTDEYPLLYGLPAANGSGKDQYVLATFVVWFALVGLKNRAIVTSFDSKQIEQQTEPSVRDLCDRVNKTFGARWFRSVKGHHVCLETGSEIVLFATDEPGRAEGYHPWPGGKMAIIVNEAKSVPEPIYDALTRCTGYSYFMLISSPASKSGSFYQNSLRGVRHPAPCKLNQWFYRHISAYECPHIPKSHIQNVIETKPQEWVDSSINAEFSSIGDTCIIPAHFLDLLAQKLPEPAGEDIGIGLDTAAGVDENSCYVRKGNRVIYSFHFRQKDTDWTADHINTHLTPWKHLQYKFNADDGGISKAISDKLVKLGWRITRRNNQSPAGNKREFLNLGIESWWKVRTLIIRKEIRCDLLNPDKTIKHEHAILHRQLTSRRYDGEESAQGKLKIEPKPAHKQRMRESPDRADAYILCFYSYKSNYFAADESKAKSTGTITMSAFRANYGWDDRYDITRPIRPSRNANFTFQSRAI